MALPPPVAPGRRSRSPWQRAARSISSSREAGAAGRALASGARAVPRGARLDEPRAIELRYTRELRDLWATAQALVAYGLRPLVAAWPRPRADDDDEDVILRELLAWFDKQAGAERAAALVSSLAAPALPTPGVVDSPAITRQIDWLQVVMGEWLQAGPAQDAIAGAARQLELFSGEALGKILRINIRAEMPALRPLINTWREANVNLIESGINAGLEEVHLRPSLLTDVSQMVEEAHASGARVETLRDRLVERFGVSDSRAELIARDQILTLNGQLNGARCQAVGIEEYRWSDSRDERTRESHREMGDRSRAGETFRWDDPPIVDGEPANPGDPILCRCNAIPVPPKWLEPEPEGE